MCLLYLLAIVFFKLTDSCCVDSSSGLKRKWELWTHPILRKRSVDIAQKRFLTALGLEDFPTPGRHVIPHKFMLELYRNLSRGNYKGNQSYDVLPSTVVGIVDQERGSNLVTPTSQQVFHFNISKVPSRQAIIDAELRILRLPTVKEESFTTKHGTTYRAKLYGKRIKDMPNLTPLEPSSHQDLLDSLEFDISDSLEENWNVFSIKKSIENWQRAKENSHELELRVESMLSGDLIPPEELGFSKTGRLYNKHALLVVYATDRKPPDLIRKPVSNENKAASNAISPGKSIDPNQDKDTSDLEHSRVRRDARSKSGGNMKKRSRGSKSKRRRKKDSCRRKPLYVDFNQLGWSTWVIAPRGYSAYFCQGLCEFPIDNHLKPTNHATVQTILNSVAPSLAPRACCSPNKFSAISILFIDTSDNIVYKKYEEMVVERCGCK